MSYRAVQGKWAFLSAGLLSLSTGVEAREQEFRLGTRALWIDQDAHVTAHERHAVFELILERLRRVEGKSIEGVARKNGIGTRVPQDAVLDRKVRRFNRVVLVGRRSALNESLVTWTGYIKLKSIPCPGRICTLARALGWMLKNSLIDIRAASPYLLPPNSSMLPSPGFGIEARSFTTSMGYSLM